MMLEKTTAMITTEAPFLKRLREKDLKKRWYKIRKNSLWLIPSARLQEMSKSAMVIYKATHIMQTTLKTTKETIAS